jgi:alcohol dehydrogenase
MITTYKVFVPSVIGSGSSLRTGLELKRLNIKKVLAVYDEGMKKVGIATKILDNLEAAGIEYVVFDKVVPDPPDTIVEEGAKLARESEIQGIVAIGGGSSMDTAKGINVLINNEPPITKYLGVQEGLKEGVPIIAIPTTSGTGSETTNMAVISLTKLNKKDSVVSSVCVPKLAILDPELTLGLPSKMTAATGVDALAHAVESLTGAHSNPLSDALSRESIRLIHKWLPITYKDGSNIEAREFMMYASNYAGMAFTNALVHVGHSIGHTLGANFHIPHGIACALVLPEVMEYASKTEYKKVAMVCEALGHKVKENATPEEIGQTAKKVLRDFIKSLDIPNIKELDIKLEDLLKVAPAVTQDSGIALAPYRITTKQVTEMLKSAYDA